MMLIVCVCSDMEVTRVERRMGYGTELVMLIVCSVGGRVKEVGCSVEMVLHTCEEGGWEVGCSVEHGKCTCRG